MPGDRGCYIIDMTDGQLWHVDRDKSPQLIGSVGEARGKPPEAK
jgi:hypothetical protein